MIVYLFVCVDYWGRLLVPKFSIVPQVVIGGLFVERLPAVPAALTGQMRFPFSVEVAGCEVCFGGRVLRMDEPIYSKCVISATDGRVLEPRLINRLVFHDAIISHVCVSVEVGLILPVA